MADGDDGVNAREDKADQRARNEPGGRRREDRHDVNGNDRARDEGGESPDMPDLADNRRRLQGSQQHSREIGGSE